MYNLAEDPKVAHELAQQGTPLLSGSEEARAASKLPSELLELAYGAAVREGGAARFDEAAARLFASHDGQQRTRLLSALASVRDEALARAIMEGAQAAEREHNVRSTPSFVFGPDGRTKTQAGAVGFEKFQQLVDEARKA